jgi:hypothetical protein
MTSVNRRCCSSAFGDAAINFVVARPTLDPLTAKLLKLFIVHY